MLGSRIPTPTSAPTAGVNLYVAPALSTHELSSRLEALPHSFGSNVRCFCPEDPNFEKFVKVALLVIALHTVHPSDIALAAGLRRAEAALHILTLQSCKTRQELAALLEQVVADGDCGRASLLAIAALHSAYCAATLSGSDLMFALKPLLCD